MPSSPEVLVTISMRFPALDAEALGDHLAPVLAAAIKVGGIFTNVSLQGYDPDEEGLSEGDA